MAQPKFFSQQDREADTGLESIFDAVFSLRDAPAGPKTSLEQVTPAELDRPDENIFDISSGGPHRAPHPFQFSPIHVAKFCILVTSLIVWYLALTLQLDVRYTKHALVCVAGLVSSFSWLWQGQKSPAGRDVSEFTWSGVASLGAGFLVFYQWSHLSAEVRENENQIGIFFVFLCICWEAPRLLVEQTPHLSDEKLYSPSRIQTGHPAASHDTTNPQTLLSVKAISQPSSLDGDSSWSRTARWEPQTITHKKPASSVRVEEQKPFYRSRADSTDSAASQSSMTTTASTTTVGWRTPIHKVPHSGGATGQSPGFNLRSLNLDDGVPKLRFGVKKDSGTGRRRI